MSVIAWYYERVSSDLKDSAESLTLFYIPTTSPFVLCVTIPYFVLLFIVFISDSYALKIAIQR